MFKNLSLKGKLLIGAVSLSLLIFAYYYLFSDADRWLDEVLFLVLFSSVWWGYILADRKFIKPLSGTLSLSRRLVEGEAIQREPASGESAEFTRLKETFYTMYDYVTNATNFIKDIESGNLDSEYTLIKASSEGFKDNLSMALISMREQMKKIDEQERERNWSTVGLARFSDILRTNTDDIKLLSKALIANLVKYMDANQGGLFLLEETDDNPSLELTACYAYGRDKFMHKRIAKGEGLVGQAYLEKDTVYLTEVPDSYVSITSGLGESNPRCILIVPMMSNEDILGVVELASFNVFKPYQIEFLKKLGESIASTVNSVRNVDRIKRLLGGSQQQAEEMRAQEEEMRQNMEELAATQEEMVRKQNEVEAMNRKLAANESVLRKALEKAKEKESEALETSEMLRAQEEEMRQNMEQLMAAKDEMEKKQAALEEANTMMKEQEEEILNNLNIMKASKEDMELKQAELELANKKMAANEMVLKKAFEKSKQKEQELREKAQQIQELQLKFMAKMDAINSSGVAAAELSTDGVFLEVNKAFTKLMGYSHEEIVGKHHSQMVDPAYAKSKEYQDFWKHLNEGKLAEGVFERIAKNGRKIQLKSVYSSVKDSSGKVVSVFKLALVHSDAEKLREETDALYARVNELMHSDKYFIIRNF